METTSEFQRFRSDVSDLLLVIKRRWRPSAITTGSLFLVVLVLASLSKPTYEASGKLRIKARSATSSLTVSGRDIGSLAGLGASTDPITTEIEIVKSLPIITKVINDLNIVDEENKPLDPEVFIQNKLTVEKPKFTDVLKISYESKSAEEASKVVNKIMNLYIEAGISSDREQAVKTEVFIRNQLPNSRAEVQKAENELRKFKQAYQISDLATEQLTASKSIAEISQKIADTRAQLESALARSGTIQKQLGSGIKEAYIQNTLNYTPAVNEASKKLKIAESDLAVARGRYQNTHPIIIDLEDRVNYLKSIYQIEISKTGVNPDQLINDSLQNKGVKDKLESDLVLLQSEISSLNAQLNVLRNTNNLYNKRTKLFPTIEQKQREYERQLDAAQSAYKLLLEKLQEARITANQGSGTANIIEYAYTNDKRLLKPVLFKVVIGLLLSILSGVLLTIWLELKDKSIKTLKETKEQFGYPAIGIIPIFEQLNRVIIGSRSDKQLERTYEVNQLRISPIFEAFRMLQSNLKFLKSDQELKTLVITSCVSGEGKSTVSANLAIAMAEKGFKVLLIDADMRKSTQHQIWKVQQQNGLSEVIVGQLAVKKAVHKIDEKLFFMSAGIMPPNPSALLDSRRMEEILNQCKNEYEYVILDTPPLLAANETLSLSNLSDGVILVARPGVTGINSAKVAKEILHKLDSKILGLVINGIDIKSEPDNYFHYESEYGSNVTNTRVTEKLLNA